MMLTVSLKTFQNKLLKMTFAVFTVKNSITWKKNGRTYFSMSNGKLALRLEDFKKFSVKEFSGILKDYNENISKKGRPPHDNLWHLLFLTKVTVSTFVIRFVYGSYYSLHLLNWVFMLFFFFFSWTLQSNLGKMILEKHQTLPFFNYTMILLNPLVKMCSARGASHTLWWELSDLNSHVLALSV